ncbi:MAG TPA: hypothetical protein VFQ44_22210 [Streptosporangiaceae bacterium]|nr:hypothetical protein [Streptosporangiaceae bacterium]
MTEPEPHTTKATLVSLAGLDGAGKTTQARLLGQWLASRDEAVVTEAPDGPSLTRSVLAEIAAELGIADHYDVLGPDATNLVMAFMRLRDWTDRVLPKLGTHRWIVTDRSAVCHYAAARAVGARNEESLRLILDRLPRPDLLLYLDVPPDVAYRRLNQRASGREETAFLEANDRAYRELPEFSEFTLVPGTGSVADVQAALRAAVCARFPDS